MKNKVLISVIGIIVLLGLGLVILNSVDQPLDQLSQLKSISDHSQVEINLGDQQLSVEVVNTPESIVQGLSGRTEMGSHGMLFVLPEKGQPQFWMKEMRFDLDLVWIADSQIVEITGRVPKPESQILPGQLPRYLPQESVDMVLEIEAGQADDWQLQVGDDLTLVSSLE